MNKLSIQDIARITGGTLLCLHEEWIEYLLVDSRKVISVEGTLFFALQGMHHDGHQFIRGLYQKGVRNFVVKTPPDDHKHYRDTHFLVVNEPLLALQQVASFIRKTFHHPVISVTGSNGKTVVKEWLSQVLSVDKKVVRSPKSYNSQVGVPLSVWLLDNRYDIGVIEAGISKPGEMKRLQEIISPDIGIFTNIGEAHQENFTSLDQKIREKLHLFEDTPVLIYCRDHEEIHHAIEAIPGFHNKEKIRWSEKPGSEVTVIRTIEEGGKTRIEGLYNNRSITIRIPFTDKASVENAIHVWCLLLYLGYPDDVIEQVTAKLEPVGMRLDVKKGINNCTIINDSYNSDLGSLSIALDFLLSQKQHEKRTLVLSDILQSGRDDEDLYAEVAKLVHQKKLTRIIGIGEAIGQHAHLFHLEKEFFHTTEQFLYTHPKNRFSNETILLKGARKFTFEKILQSLELQIHQTELEINLDALAQNLNHFRSMLNPTTRIMVMVKAFSYGTGSFEIANMLQFQRVDALAVAFADEGVILREGGITLPIMVMNPELAAHETIIQHDLEPEIYSFTILEGFSAAVRKNGLNQFPVHIKLDTGMNRLGFTAGEVEELKEILLKHPEIRVQSIFSHLAASERKEHDEFTHRQIGRFEEMSENLMASLNYPVTRHILNSSGIERFPHAQFDMVRLGIGLYGISSCNQGRMKNVSTLKSRISQLKTVRAGESIGYGRSSMAKEEMKIAVVPVGYADGLNRKLGNGVGRFVVKNRKVAVVGDICMDMCMVDVTGLNASVGDEVEIFGEKNPVTELAKKIDTIPYEILTGVSQRVKRVYFQEG